MPHLSELDDDDNQLSKNEDQQTSDISNGGQNNPWFQALAVAGFVNWTHQKQTLLSVPFLYDPNPFLPTDPILYTPNLLFSDPSRVLQLAGVSVTSLPILAPGDQWVMVDPYWRHEMLGWLETREYGESESGTYGVSQSTIEVGNLLYDAEDTDHMNLKGYVYCLFRPAGLIVSSPVPLR